MTFHSIRQKPAVGEKTAGGSRRLPPTAVPETLFHRVAGEAARLKVPVSAIIRRKLILAYQIEADRGDKTKA